MSMQASLESKVVEVHIHETQNHEGSMTFKCFTCFTSSMYLQKRIKDCFICEITKGFSIKEILYEYQQYRR